MKIAIPVENDILFTHFGHAPSFAFFEVDEKEKKILGRKDEASPPHEPGLLPAWLATRGVTHVIAGGLGARAIALFEEKNITLVVGATEAPATMLVQDFLDGTLGSGKNACDH